MIAWLINKSLNLVPRRFLQRVAHLVVPVVGLFYRGRGRICPICHNRYRRFMPYGYGSVRHDALCPSCLSLERHRALWLYLTEHTRIFEEHPTLLHIAPEISLMRHFKRAYAACRERYITADLESPLAELHFDVEQIPLDAESVDVIICNHLLEHVADDRRAMRELYRILRSGGWAVVMVPQDESRAATYEDDSITDPKERAVCFGQYDHRRIYGRDYAERLAAEGFEVEQIDYRERLTEEECQRYGLSGDKIYVAHRPANKN